MVGARPGRPAAGGRGESVIRDSEVDSVKPASDQRCRPALAGRRRVAASPSLTTSKMGSASQRLLPQAVSHGGLQRNADLSEAHLEDWDVFYNIHFMLYTILAINHKTRVT